MQNQKYRRAATRRLNNSPTDTTYGYESSIAPLPPRPPCTPCSDGSKNTASANWTIRDNLHYAWEPLENTVATTTTRFNNPVLYAEVINPRLQRREVAPIFPFTHIFWGPIDVQTGAAINKTFVSHETESLMHTLTPHGTRHNHFHMEDLLQDP